jgi:hypothetical protein
MRRVGTCSECGESREMATSQLCFACYRRAERAQERSSAVVDRHSTPLRREHKRAIRAFAQVMAGLADLGVSKQDLVQIREIITPYLAPLMDYFPTASRVNVNTPSRVHVHAESDAPGGATSKPA